MVVRVWEMNPVLSSCFRNGSQLEVAALGTSVELLMGALEQSLLSCCPGPRPRLPKTLRYCSALPSGDFGDPSGLTTATCGTPATVVEGCAALPLMNPL